MRWSWGLITLQLADFLSGLIAYVNRELKTSSSKLALTERLQQVSGYSLCRTTLLKENKINLFRRHAERGYMSNFPTQRSPER